MINRYFFLELIVLLICPLPFWEHYVVVYYEIPGNNGIFQLRCNYFVSDFILVFMFFRFFFLVRSVINYSIYTDAYSKKICLQYGFTSAYRFASKSHLAMSPATTVFTVFAFIVFILAYIVRIFELPYYINDVEDSEGLEKFYNAIWFIVITITTVGYGDIYPRTVYGKMVAMSAALLGALLISLFVLASSKLVDLTEP